MQVKNTKRQERIHMNKVEKQLTEELNVLDEIIVKAEKSLEGSPTGILRISRSGNTMQYYRREDEKDRNGKYIKKKDMGFVYELAQKDYDETILNAARSQKKKISGFLRQYAPDKLKNIYTTLTPERQLLTTPHIIPDAQYVSKWKNRVYEGKGFREDAPEIYTENGEWVRSKSEKMLADKLKAMNIPYLYEYPLYLNGYGFVYPDFTLLNVRTREEFYLEHFGMMDDETYSESAVLKIESYEKNGIFPGEKLLITYETSKHPLDMKLFEQIIKRYLV